MYQVKRRREDTAFKVLIGMLISFFIIWFLMGQACQHAADIDKKFSHEQPVDFCIIADSIQDPKRISAQQFVVTMSGCTLFHNFDAEGQKLHAHAVACGSFIVLECN